MIGLKRGSVKLISHQEEWNKNAEKVILKLKQLLGDAAVDIQHVGSTAIASIYAKPIIDIVIGVRDLNDVVSYEELLKQHDFVFRGEDVEGQLLFVMGDFEKDTRTHHIHVVKWNGEEWNNYINFRDYLNCCPDKAMLYDACKKKLASQFPDDRRSYTAGKQELIECLLKEAETFALYSSMQDLNRSAIKYAADTIEIGMSLSDIKELLENYLLENGADSFWYWDVGAFIFAGEETALSVSGKDYKVADRVIQSNDIITIDLSPQRNGIWGDYARTLVFEDGVLCDETSKIKKEEWRKGLQMEEYLHQTLIDVGTPDMTFEELYGYMNELIVKKGFLNLDFLGNLGHSIEKNKNDRIYTEKGNRKRLSDVTIFTFEPHISIPNSRYGYKKEDIYYFANGKLVRL
ncbi:GrpB family protein [Lachnospiraceae bacterium 56-18]